MSLVISIVYRGMTRIGVILAFGVMFATVIAIAQAPVPQLPQVYIDTTFHPPAGVTWKVHSSAELNKALADSKPGDTIVLDAGAAYEGNFIFPAKPNPNGKWIYIVGSALAKLPVPGTRVNPSSDAAAMPKIVTPNVNAALTLPPGANHYRFVGLEIYSASTQGCNRAAAAAGNCYSYQLMYGASIPGQPLVDSITVDRCYIHGAPTQDVRQGIQANGSNFAVIDSYLSDIHQTGSDSQAILAYYTPGPLKIVNNLLSATTEDVMIGGGGGVNNPWVPSDIEIRGNHFYKPLSWARVGVTIPPNNQWVVKNNLEFKSARRVLVDGNLMENVWVSGQMGFSLMMTPRPHASGNLAVVDDITISNNVLKNVSSGFDTMEFDDACTTTPGCTNRGEMRRVKLYNNLILLGDTSQPGYSKGYNTGGLIMHDLTDFVVQHNTVMPPPNLGYCGVQGSLLFNAVPPFTPPRSSTHNVWILDNVLCRQISGPRGMIGQFPYVLSDYMGDPSPVDPRFSGNVMHVAKGDKAWPLPPNNVCKFVAFGDSEPKRNERDVDNAAWMKTTDGVAAGVDRSKLEAAYAADNERMRSRSSGEISQTQP